MCIEKRQVAFGRCSAAHAFRSKNIASIANCLATISCQPNEFRHEQREHSIAFHRAFDRVMVDGRRLVVAGGPKKK